MLLSRPVLTYHEADSAKASAVEPAYEVFGYLPKSITGNIGEDTHLSLSAGWKLSDYTNGNDGNGLMRGLSTEENSIISQIFADAEASAEYTLESFSEEGAKNIGFNDLPNSESESHADYLMMIALPEVNHIYDGEVTLTWSFE